MMNDDVLRNIEYLREKADVSYEEAANLLEKFEGNVMRVLVELERQGRVYPQPGAEPQPDAARPPHQKQAEEFKKQTASFMQKALQHRLVVEGGEDKKQVVANLSLPFCAGATLIAPHLAVGSVALMFVLGYRVRIRKQPMKPFAGDVDEFVDRTVSNIKRTASSFANTAREVRQGAEVKEQKENCSCGHADDDDEGGEITVE